MPSYTRPLSGPLDGGMRIGCSDCGGTYMWPHEIGREPDGAYRCFRACAKGNDRVTDARMQKNTQAKKAERVSFHLPGAPAGGVEDV